MVVREEADAVVERLFGRAPLVEDWRCVGRWAYAAAWLATDRKKAEALVHARLAGAARLATQAAMTAGRGDAERFTLISALARLPEAFGGTGPLTEAVFRGLDEAADLLLAEGETLRRLTYRERAAHAAPFRLEAFEVALRDSGSERQVMLREVCAYLDEALLGSSGDMPALRALRIFLKSSLALDTQEAAAAMEPPHLENAGQMLTTLTLWLSADLALSARRSSAFDSAWTAAARYSGDGLSRIVSGLTSLSTIPSGVVESLAHDPWPLVLALAMTSHGEHASSILEWGSRAQAEARRLAVEETAAWAKATRKLEELEQKLGVQIDVPFEARRDTSGFATSAGGDLFSAWNAIHRARDGRRMLKEGTDQAVRAESSRRRESVRRAKAALDAVRAAHEQALASARSEAEVAPVNDVVLSQAEEGAQRGCLYGFGTGCGVMATYAGVAFVVGTAGTVGKLGPLVMGVAALPVLVAIVGQITVALRRAASNAETARLRRAATAAYERARMAADRSHGVAMKEGLERLREAETSLQVLDRQLASATRD